MMKEEKEAHKGYKITELGEIPFEWEVAILGDYLIEHKEKSTENNQYPPLTSSRRGLFLQTDYFNKQIASKDNTGYNVVPRGYFTFRHMSDDATFHFNINNLVDKGIVSTLYPVFTNSLLLNKKFLLYTLNEGSNFKRFSLLQKQGGSRTYMYFRKLKEFKFALPPLKEQQKIVEVLSTVDEQIDNTDQLIDKTKKLKKGLMQQLLTKGIGHTEYKQTKIGTIPSEWETGLLDELTDKITDGAHKTPKYTEEGIPFLRVVDIQSKVIDWHNTKYISLSEHQELIKRCHPEKGDILLSKNGTIGLAKLIDWEEEFSIFVSLCLIKIKKQESAFLAEYLLYLLESEVCQKQFKDSSKQGTVTNLHLEEIRKLIVPIPSLNEQEKIAEILSAVDDQIESYEKEKEKYTEFKKGLMQQLLMGRIRVTV